MKQELGRTYFNDHAKHWWTWSMCSNQGCNSKTYEDLAGILTLPHSKVRSIKNGPLTPLMRSSTLSCGKERMAAIVRIRRSEREYLLWMLCIIYHILELIRAQSASTCSGLPETNMFIIYRILELIKAQSAPTWYSLPDKPQSNIYRIMLNVNAQSYKTSVG